jgi:hypothetical protein
MTLSKAVYEMVKIIKLLKVEDRKTELLHDWDSSVPRLNARIFITNTYNKYIEPYLDESAISTLTQIRLEYYDSIPRPSFNTIANRYGYYTNYEIDALQSLCFCNGINSIL